MIHKSDSLSIQLPLLLHRVYRLEQRVLLEQERDVNVTDLSILQKCMLGLGLGDVLGCPVEGMDYAEIQRRYGEINDLIVPPYTRNWRLAGLHSDDTQQALLVISALTHARQRATSSQQLPFLAAEHLANMYISGLHAPLTRNLPCGCWRGTGTGFRDVVNNLWRLQADKRSTFPFGAGKYSAGLGAVMRIPPVGVILKDVDSLADVVIALTLVSHIDPLAISSAYAIAIACHELALGYFEIGHRKKFLESLATKVNIFEQELPSRANNIAPNILNQSETPYLVSDLIAWLDSILNEPVSNAMHLISENIYQLTKKRIHPTNGYAPAGVIASLYFFLCGKQSFFGKKPLSMRESVFLAINAGGDTDTIGSIVGSLCAVSYGLNGTEDLLNKMFGIKYINMIVDENISYNLGKSNYFTNKFIDIIKSEDELTYLEENTRNILNDKK